MVRNFSELSLREDVVSALTEVGVTKPTLIQMLAIPKILRGKNVICASETGLHEVGLELCILRHCMHRESE